jgi:hypothetical protein
MTDAPRKGHYDIEVAGEVRVVIDPSLVTMGEACHDAKFQAFRTLAEGRRWTSFATDSPSPPSTICCKAQRWRAAPVIPKRSY